MAVQIWPVGMQFDGDNTTVDFRVSDPSGIGEVVISVTISDAGGPDHALSEARQKLAQWAGSIAHVLRQNP